MAGLIIPKQLPNPEGQAKLILASNALPFIQPLFFKINKSNLDAEQQQQNALITTHPNNWMGLPVFDEVTFDLTEYRVTDVADTPDTKGAGDKNIRKVGNFSLTNVMHVVSMVKNVIRTPIAGGDGTVKEYIGLSDYNITLSGWLVSQHQNVPPTLEIKELFELCKAPVPIKVASNFLSYFDIFNIVIEGEPTFTQIEGTRNAVQFTINCVSDKPFEVEMNSTPVVTNFASTLSFS